MQGACEPSRTGRQHFHTVRCALEDNMATARQLLIVLSVLVTTAGVPPRRNFVLAAPNDNRVAAGSLRDGVLTIALEVRQATWHPDGDQLPGMNIEAFAEVGKDASVPGPLLRVPLGTAIRASLRNALPTDTITFVGARPGESRCNADRWTRSLCHREKFAICNLQRLSRAHFSTARSPAGVGPDARHCAWMGCLAERSSLIPRASPQLP